MAMDTAAETPIRPRPRSRIDLVDLARGLALLAMFVFHFAYDLSYFGLIEVDVPSDPGWRWFARTIAASFLTIVGISLVLATRNGLNRQAFLKRLAMVVAAAMLVTVGTWFALPDAFIFFGILHQVALASVLALAFLRLPALPIAIAALAVFALAQLPGTAFFDQPWLFWLGLARDVPDTADFVPVLPWFGWVLTGMALGKLVLPRLEASRLAAWQATSRPARIIAWGGRHSLLVYLLHQPLFLGALMLALPFFATPASQQSQFISACHRSCAGNGLGVDACEKLCACTVDGIKSEQLWEKALANTLAPTESSRISGLAQACTARFAPRP